MDKQRTLSIIKPDAVEKNVIGKILSRFEESNLKVVGLKMLHLTKEQGAEFYDVHRERPFFGELIEYITGGPVVVSVLEGEDAVALNRKLMGATDPKEADAGTIRADFAQDITANAVHGSDSVENAAREISFFFPNL